MTDHVQKNMNYRRASLFFLGLISFLLVCAALKLTTAVFLPFIIAVLLTFVMEPLVHLLGRFKIPRAIASIVIVLGTGALFYFVGVLLFSSVKSIASLYPKYEVRFEEIYKIFAQTFQLPYNAELTLFDNLWSQLNVRAKVQSMALQYSEYFIGFAGKMVMVTLFIIFLLLEIGHVRQRAELAFQRTFPGGLKKIIDNIVLQMTKYLSIKFFMSLSTGLIVGVGLKILGMDFAVVWGVLAFVLNFIPTIGSIAAGLGITVFSIVQFYPDPIPVVIASTITIVANFIIGNIIEPKVQGDNLGLSPFIVLVSLLVWGWLWGFAGLVLAVPMTVIVKIFCESIPGLEAISILMGSYKAAIKKEEFESK